MSAIIVSDSPLEGSEAFLAEVMQELANHKIKAIAIVALPEDYAGPDGYVMTNYYNATLFDMQAAAAQIQGDIIDRTVKANLKSWLEEIDQEDEGGEPWADT